MPRINTRFNPDRQPQAVADAVPRSDDAEKGVLSALLQDASNIIHDAAENLPPEAFYHVGNRMIYEELLGLKDREFDLVVFSQHLIDKGLMGKVGGPAFIAELASFIPTPAHYSYYKGILLEKLSLRKILDGVEEIKQNVLTSQGDINALKEGVIKGMSCIKEAIDSSEVKQPTWEEEVDEWVDDFEAMCAGKKSSGMETQWESWNKRLGGISPGYTIISGQSSSGKSTLLGNIMRWAALEHKRPCLYVSYEMPVRMVISRIAADLADVDGGCLFKPDVMKPSDYQMRKISDAIKMIRSSSLRVVHKPHLSAEGVCHIARKMFIDKGDIVIGIDYLQLIQRPSNIEDKANREREVATNSAVLRTFSKEIDRPVIVLSQLNEDGETRESKSIQMDCDTHIRVDRLKEKIKGKDGKMHPTGKIIDNGLYAEKNRNDEAHFSLPIHLLGRRFRFEDHSISDS